MKFATGGRARSRSGMYIERKFHSKLRYWSQCLQFSVFNYKVER